MRLRGLLARGILLSSIAVGLSPARPLRFEELARVLRLGGFSLSPDGRSVAFAVATADVEGNTSSSAIWIVPAAGGQARRLTSGEKRDSDPRFSPDGKAIAFLSNRDGSSQVWLLAADGGEPRKISSFPTEVGGFRWTPDGKSFVFTSDVFPECVDAACLARKKKEREASKVKARVAERLLFRHWDAWKDGARTHVWKIPVDGGEAVDLTPGDRDAPPFAVGGSMDFIVAPDGRELAYASNPDEDEALSTNSDVWIVPLVAGGKPKNLTADNRGWDGWPRYSPDGKWIAYRSQERAGFEADRFRLMLLDRTTGARSELTVGFDASVEDFAWSPDSRTVFFTTHRAARGAIYRVGLDGKGMSEIWRGATASSPEISPDGREVFFQASSLTRPAEVWAVGTEGQGTAGGNRSPLTPALSRDGGDGSPLTPALSRRERGEGRAVTRLNDALLSRVEIGAVSERWTGSADGRRLHAWVIHPPGFDPQKKYPAVLWIHGGPQSAWTDSWSYRWNPQVWAAYGYVVYAANPRGSTSFGQKLTDEISRDWGGKVYDDLMRQTDDLFSLPYVDGARVGAAGASYGGYMIAWIAGHTDRFRALVCHDGVVDTRSMGLETEELWFTKWDFGGMPWESELYEKWNPIRHAAKFQTPTLVITSEKDYRVPFGQGLQFFTALQVQGVASKLLMFPDEGHWVLKPGNSRLWHATVMDWLHRYLGGAEAEAQALETVYSVTR